MTALIRFDPHVITVTPMNKDLFIHLFVILQIIWITKSCLSVLHEVWLTAQNKKYRLFDKNIFSYF